MARITVTRLINRTQRRNRAAEVALSRIKHDHVEDTRSRAEDGRLGRVGEGVLDLILKPFVSMRDDIVSVIRTNGQ